MRSPTTVFHFRTRPRLHQPIEDVRIGLRKRFRDIGRLAAKENDGHIRRIDERTAEYEFSAGDGCASVIEMSFAEL